MSEYREERDSLGNIFIPSDALYGAQTMRALQNNKISGHVAHPALIRAYLFIKKAAAKANAAAGALPQLHADLIIRAVDQVLLLPESKWPEIFPLDPYQAGAGTSQNMNLNEVIANMANQLAGKPLGCYSPVHPNDHVNCSQSTNDTFPAAMRLATLEVSQSLVAELKLLANAFFLKAEGWKNIPKAARTHLQDAVPITLGQEFSGYSVTLKKCALWIEQGRNELRELGIGGSAVGTGLNVPSGYLLWVLPELEKYTGEKLYAAENLFTAMQSQSSVAYYSSMLRLSALELTRICNDLRLLASGPSTGFAEIFLPVVQPGSSIMPGKVNPSILEMANQAWYSVLGYDHTIVQCIQAGQLELNVMVPMMAYSVLEASQVMARALTTLRQLCVEGIEPNIAKLRFYFESTSQVATVFAPRLGYTVTAELVKEALQSDCSVVQLIRKKKLMSDVEIEEFLKRLTSPEKCL